jgi:hypothetical protein
VKGLILPSGHGKDVAAFEALQSIPIEGEPAGLGANGRSATASSVFLRVQRNPADHKSDH